MTHQPTHEAVAAAEAFCEAADHIEWHDESPELSGTAGFHAVNADLLASHFDAFAASSVAAAVAAERTRIKDRMIRKALELRCEAGKYKSHLVFHEIVACAMTLESFAAELEKEPQK